MAAATQRTATAREVALILFLYAISLACGLPGPDYIFLSLWLLVSALYIHRRYSLSGLVYPICAIWWVGLFVAAVSLYFFSSQYVGIDKAVYPTNILYTLCFTSLLVGGRLAEGRMDRLQLSPVTGSGLDVPRLTRVGLSCLVVGALANVYLVSKVGNPYATDNPEAARTNLEAGNGAIGTLGFTLTILGVAVLAMAGILRRRNEVTILPMVFRLSVIGFSLSAMALTGTRLILARALVVIVVILCFQRFGRVPVVAGAVLASGLIATVGLLGQRRYVGQRLGVVDILAQRFSSDPQVGGLMYQDALHGHWLGKALITPFLTYLPGSQPNLGTLLKDELGLVFAGGGIATPLPLEGFLDFGWPGAILYGLLAGAVAGVITQISVRRGGAASIIILVISGVTLAGVTAGLGTTLATYLMPQLVVSLFVIRVFLRPGAAAETGPVPEEGARERSTVAA